MTTRVRRAAAVEARGVSTGGDGQVATVFRSGIVGNACVTSKCRAVLYSNKLALSAERYRTSRD
jgi:hypothetical protein